MTESIRAHLGEPAVSVPTQPKRPRAERFEAIQCLGRERAISEITVEHDEIGRSDVGLGQHSVEGRCMAVDIRQDDNTFHGGSLQSE